MSIFKDITVLITGVTGSFGNTRLWRFFDSDIKDYLRSTTFVLP